MNDGYTHADIKPYTKRREPIATRLAEAYIDPDYWP